MKMVNPKFVLRALAFGAITAQSWAVANDAAWNNLKHVTHSGSYHLISRTGQFVGKITNVTDALIVIKEGYGKGAPIEIPRTDVIQISDGAAGLLYSSRNSWSEVISLAGMKMQGFDVGKGSFRVVTVAGRQYLTKTLRVTNSDVTAEPQRGHEVTVPKAEVARVDYIRAAPWPEGVEQGYQEFGPLSVFNPGYWPHMLHFNGKITVPVYDASLPENDVPCKFCMP